MPTRPPGLPEAAPPPALVLRSEGGTQLWLPAIDHPRGPARRTAVFYNPAMSLDRDLNVAVARAAVALQRSPVDGWEMLGATGVRGLRVAHETSFLRTLRITERDPRAFAVLKQNTEEVGAPGIQVDLADALDGAGGRTFGYVDLDPYGSPLPFLPAMFAALEETAIIGVSATDMMVLAGVTRGACERLYGARPLRGRFAPEAGLRILIARLVREAEMRGRTARPLVAYVHDHHVRAYLEVRRAPASPPAESSIATIEPEQWKGPALGTSAAVGPMWLGPLANPEWISAASLGEFPAEPRSSGAFLARLKEESAVDRPFYYEPNELARQLGLREPPSLERLLAGLRARGAVAVRAHPREAAFRTTASRAEVEAVVRSLAR